MYYFKAILQYQGTNYSGFQWLNGLHTIQDEINKSFLKVLGCPVSTMSASRTDSGVHALNQIIKITSPIEFDCFEIQNKMNSTLPVDIKILEITPCNRSFRPNSAHKSKEYCYYFTNDQIPNSNHQIFTANISRKLDILSMQECLKVIIGTHDFCNFHSMGSNVKSTIRTVYECDLKIVNPQVIFKNSSIIKIPSDLQRCYQLRIVADGFLKQMIRHIVSALWLVGTGKNSIDTFKILLNSPKQKTQLRKVAPPNGLFLVHINY